MKNRTEARRLPEDFAYLPEMYQDSYFPPPLVDKLRDIIKAAVGFLEEGGHATPEIQESFDQMVSRINDLQEEFADNDSELETGAREAIGETVGRILQYFEVDMDIEAALRGRDW